MDTTLIIMAAGIGSRFGTGIKQLARWLQMERLSWIFQSMMRKKLDLQRLFS